MLSHWYTDSIQASTRCESNGKFCQCALSKRGSICGNILMFSIFHKPRWLFFQSAQWVPHQLWALPISKAAASGRQLRWWRTGEGRRRSFGSEPFQRCFSSLFPFFFLGHSTCMGRSSIGTMCQAVTLKLPQDGFLCRCQRILLLTHKPVKVWTNQPGAIMTQTSKEASLLGQPRPI